MIQHRRTTRRLQGRRSTSFRLLTCLLLLSVAAFATACASRGMDPASRDAALRKIAAEYARTDDLNQAQAALDKLGLANPGQLLVSVAESDLSAGRSRDDIEAAAHLAEMLGARSQKVAAYLTPSPVPAPTQLAAVLSPEPTVLAATIVVPSPVPPSPTAAPATEAPTATALPPSPTSAPPTSSPTPEPQNPRVVAANSVNLRGGPGKEYPLVARLAAGKEAPIIGRNSSGDWWQLQMTGVKQAWVAGTVVRVLGAIDTVEVAKNIPPVPTAAPKPTAAPQPTAAPAKPPVAAGPHFTATRRLWTVEETGGIVAGGLSVNCDGAMHTLHVYVKDAAGNLLNGVTIQRVGGDRQELVSGSKAAGMAEYDLYPPGTDVVVVRDVDGRPATSETGAAPSVPAAIPFDILRGAHYCRDDADCAHLVSEFGCGGHYSWDVVFTRNY